MHPFQAVFAGSLWQAIGKMTIHFEANTVFEAASPADSLASKEVVSLKTHEYVYINVLYMIYCV